MYVRIDVIKLGVGFFRQLIKNIVISKIYVH